VYDVNVSVKMNLSPFERILIDLYPVGMRLLWPGILICSTWGHDASRTIQVELQLQHINCINFSAKDGPRESQENLVSK